MVASPAEKTLIRLVLLNCHIRAQCGVVYLSELGGGILFYKELYENKVRIIMACFCFLFTYNTGQIWLEMTNTDESV